MRRFLPILTVLILVAGIVFGPQAANAVTSAPPNEVTWNAWDKSKVPGTGNSVDLDCDPAIAQSQADAWAIGAYRAQMSTLRQWPPPQSSKTLNCIQQILDLLSLLTLNFSFSAILDLSIQALIDAILNRICAKVLAKVREATDSFGELKDGIVNINKGKSVTIGGVPVVNFTMSGGEYKSDVFN